MQTGLGEGSMAWKMTMHESLLNYAGCGQLGGEPDSHAVTVLGEDNTAGQPFLFDGLFRKSLMK